MGMSKLWAAESGLNLTKTPYKTHPDRYLLSESIFIDRYTARFLVD
jgi:hypothetical protein